MAARLATRSTKLENEEKQEQTKIGNYMMLAMWVFGFGLVALLTNNYIEKQRNPNDHVVTSVDGSKRSISLQRSRYDQYLVTGFINNEETIFLVDTGASSVSIPVSIAERAGLKRGGEIQILTANGVGTAYTTKVDSLRIGDFEIRNVSAHINPGLETETLLGMSVLGQFELVQRGDELIIRDP